MWQPRCLHIDIFNTLSPRMHSILPKSSREITEGCNDVILKIVFIEHLLCNHTFYQPYMPLILTITCLLVNYPY